MTKYIILFLLVFSIGSAWTAHEEIQKNATLTAQNKILTEAQNRAIERQKSDRQVLVARQAKIASQARKLAEAQQALSGALQRNESWRDTQVPEEVQNALQSP